MVEISVSESSWNISRAIFFRTWIEVVGTSGDHCDEAWLSFDEIDNPEKSKDQEAGDIENFLLEILIIVVWNILRLIVSSSNSSHAHYAHDSSKPHSEHNHGDKEVEDWNSDDSLGLCEEISSSVNDIDCGFQLVVSAVNTTHEYKSKHSRNSSTDQEALSFLSLNSAVSVLCLLPHGNLSGAGHK